MRTNKGDRKNPWAGGKKARAMIVDDHAAFRQALAVVMERRAGFEVCAEAASAEEARRVLQALGEDLDLAVVDLDLPGSGAEDLVRELRGRTPGAAVLGLTAVRDGATSATSEVLCTNVSLEELLATARHLVG